MDSSARNIILCCDGTGNEVEGNLSNVLKLFRIAKKNERQHVWYDPGVGTIGHENSWARLKQDVRGFFGMATGAGLDDNILDAYRFLCTAYKDGDRIFLFGFSRGAYTVRALAGFIHMVGLLYPDQLNVAGYALTAYKHAAEKDDLHIAWDFSRTIGARRVPIHFVGVWDTVASMIVPRPDRLYLPSLRTLPYTRKNPSVRVFRQAIAIDERRRMFRLNAWTEPQAFVENPFARPPKTVPQDTKQMCFAGVHADIGGGYTEAESGLSKFPLAWLIGEAKTHGLEISEPMLGHLVEGKALPGGTHPYVAPDAAGPLHKSLKGFWWLLEFIPKRVKWREWKRPSLLGFYIPAAEPRRMPSTATIHPSLIARMEECPGYRPINLPAHSAAGSASMDAPKTDPEGNGGG